MIYSVVDENVLHTANGYADHVGLDCQEACIDFLASCISTCSLVLDSERTILEFYGIAFDYTGQPGVGDAFYRWAIDNAWKLRCHELATDVDGEYSAFPRDPRLNTFDRDDRKWVALALTAGQDVQIVNAVDSDYAGHAEALSDAGLSILELCPDSLKASSGSS